jgi:protein involved in polysaccharide export with SLBB domain
MPETATRLVRLAFVLILVLVRPALLSAQLEDGGIVPKSGEDIFQTMKLDKSPAASNLPVVPIERAIDPAWYRLGPNDLLTISLQTGAGEGAIPVTVSVDNTVLIPRGPVLDVKGMTLLQLRRKVEEYYRSRRGSYQNIGVSLTRPRPIYVTVEGDVLTPDRYALTAADRVTTAIDAANQLRDRTPAAQLRDMAIESGQRDYDEGGRRQPAGVDLRRPPIRSVTIRHNDGSSEEADLVRYQAFGNEKDNPTLREGDQLIVRAARPTEGKISVAGAVNAQKLVPWRQGDNALMLYRLGAGLTSQAIASGAYLSRQGPTGRTNVSVDLTDTAALARIELSPGDGLYVPSLVSTASAEAGVVTISGEVRQPGSYPIVPGVTKVSEIITLAGGFTTRASLNGGQIIRVPNTDLPSIGDFTDEPVAGMSTSSLYLQDSSRYKYDQLQTNRVSVNFAAVQSNPNGPADVVLDNGDQIIIPTDPRSVNIKGRVRFPGWVQYRPGATHLDYIAAAGGFTAAADQERVQVVRFGTGIFEDATGAAINSGDEIYVAGEVDTPARTGLEITNTIVGIAGVIISVTLAILGYIRESNK